MPKLFARTPWDGQPGFWAALNRFFYQFEGPASLGAGHPEEPYRPPENPTCPVCGGAMADHEIRRGGPGERTLLRCPPRDRSGE